MDTSLDAAEKTHLTMHSYDSRNYTLGKPLSVPRLELLTFPLVWSAELRPRTTSDRPPVG